MSGEARCTVTVTIHPWCLDPSRDEAVRAAEDNRQGPLPTLEEAIAQAFGFDDASVQRACDETKTWPADSASSAPEQENKGNDMATKAEIQATAYRAEATSERTENVTERRPPEPGGGGNVTGLRTQRGTLAGQMRRQSQTLAQSPLSLSLVRMGELIDERDTAIRELEELRGELERANDKHQSYRHTALDRITSLESQLESVADRAAAAETAMEAAPAASGAAGTEVVAWGVMVQRDSKNFCVPFPVREAADHFVALNGVNERMSVVPLYAAPQPAKGWLTAEEREAVAFAARKLRELANQQYRNGDEATATDTSKEADFVDAILARSTPPEVVLPVSWTETNHINRVMSAEAVIAALAAAGAKWKEVGRE